MSHHQAVISCSLPHACHCTATLLIVAVRTTSVCRRYMLSTASTWDRCRPSMLPLQTSCNDRSDSTPRCHTCRTLVRHLATSLSVRPGLLRLSTPRQSDTRGSCVQPMHTHDAMSCHVMPCHIMSCQPLSHTSTSHSLTGMRIVTGHDNQRRWVTTPRRDSEQCDGITLNWCCRCCSSQEDRSHKRIRSRC